METLQEKSLEFNSNMIVSNDGGQLSNDAGLLLLFEFLHKINFDNLLTEHFHLK
ncbi:transposase, partial [Enterococcus faecium]